MRGVYFSGGTIAADAGVQLPARLDPGPGLIRRLAACFTARWDPRLVEHRIETVGGQRVFALASGDQVWRS